MSVFAEFRLPADAFLFAETFAAEPELLVDLLERTPRREEAFPPGRRVVAGALAPAELRLYHVHLPKLQATGLVRRDGRATDAREGPQFERARPVLELSTEHAEKLPSGLV